MGPLIAHTRHIGHVPIVVSFIFVTLDPFVERLVEGGCVPFVERLVEGAQTRSNC